MIYVDVIKEAIKELNNYTENNKTYNFFYDETNNYRKVSLSNKGFNDNKVLTDNFTLGGICIEKDKSIDISCLIEELKLQKNQELKAKTFFRKMNAFEECISHKKLNLILNWILENAYIHYSDLDGFYYTVIDIVDSICDTEIGRKLPWELQEAFKSELYILLKGNIIQFFSLCKETNYPNISSENVELFCNSLIELIERVSEEDDRWFTLEIFRQLIKAKRKCKELIFLTDNLEHTIVESFYSLRQQSCIVFENSYHIFDKELKDEEEMNLNKMLLNDGTELNNFEFMDSKKYIELQISDIIIYLISKYLKFLTYNSTEDIDNKIKNLTEVARRNLEIFIKILNKSDQENSFFIRTVTAEKIRYHRQVMNKHIEFLIND